MSKEQALYERRKTRVRTAIRKKSGGRVRLSVFRSGKHIYAQLIDDSKGVTLAQASTVEEALRKKAKSGANVDAAKTVGELIAERGKKVSVTEVVFDRGGYLYHGRIKALADGARSGGLSF
jgi:large subunit ribosomal protein L18